MKTKAKRKSSAKGKIDPEARTAPRAKPAPGHATVKNIRPLADRILLRRTEVEEVSAGGIVIPDTAKEKPLQGEVVATGPGRVSDKGKRVPSSLKKGDRVLIGKYSGTEVKLHGTDYVILREEDVLGIVQK